MIWGVDDATVLGLAGIISSALIAAFGYWYNYATRSQPYQTFLYQKQIETCMQISSEMSKLLQPCYEYFKRGKQESPENRSEFDKITVEAVFGMNELLNKGEIILPEEVYAAMWDLTDLLASQWETLLVNTVGETGVSLIRRAEFKVYNAMRLKAGINPLTEQTGEVFGQERQKQSSTKAD